MSDNAVPDEENGGDFQYIEKPLDLGTRIAEFDPTPYMRQIRGRGGSQTDYLDVKHRLLWLRKEHPDAEIVSELIRIDEQGAIFKATVKIPNGGCASGHGSETATDFSDYIEKAETKALGRALNALGYGAQFADSEAEESRPGAGPVLSRPVEQRESRQRPSQQQAQIQTPLATSTSNETGAVPLADYSWTAFWEWARAQGFASKEDLERTIGKSTAGMSPAEIRDLLASQGG